MTGLLSPVHLGLIALVLLLVFGGRRLPELGRLTGTAVRTRVLGKDEVARPPLPEATDTPPNVPRERVTGPSGPATAPGRPTVGTAVATHARQHALRAVVRRLPGPLGLIARLLVR